MTTNFAKAQFQLTSQPDDQSNRQQTRCAKAGALFLLVGACTMSSHALLPNPTVLPGVLTNQLASSATTQVAPQVKNATTVPALTINQGAANVGVSRTVIGSAGAATNQAVPSNQSIPMQTQVTHSMTQPNLAPQAAVSQVTSQASQDVATAIYAYVVRNQAGAESLEPVTQSTRLNSGDVVEYHGYFSNRSADRLRTLTATMTVPDGMEFIGAQTPIQALASMDGNRFLRMPLRANIDGQAKDLPLVYYKALRWDFENVGLQGTAVVKYRAKMK